MLSNSPQFYSFNSKFQQPHLSQAHANDQIILSHLGCLAIVLLEITQLTMFLARI